ncbi:hypothetical protein ACFLYF_01045 [Chloroflexota bacterium]
MKEQKEKEKVLVPVRRSMENRDNERREEQNKKKVKKTERRWYVY